MVSSSPQCINLPCYECLCHVLGDCQTQRNNCEARWFERNEALGAQIDERWKPAFQLRQPRILVVILFGKPPGLIPILHVVHANRRSIGAIFHPLGERLTRRFLSNDVHCHRVIDRMADTQDDVKNNNDTSCYSRRIRI